MIWFVLATLAPTFLCVRDPVEQAAALGAALGHVVLLPIRCNAEAVR